MAIAFKTNNRIGTKIAITIDGRAITLKGRNTEKKPLYKTNTKDQAKRLWVATIALAK